METASSSHKVYLLRLLIIYNFSTFIKYIFVTALHTSKNARCFTHEEQQTFRILHGTYKHCKKTKVILVNKKAASNDANPVNYAIWEVLQDFPL